MEVDILNRRQFTGWTGRLILLGSVGVSLPMIGCDWVGFLIRYIPIINAGIDTITGYFGGLLPPLVGPIINTIKAALLDIDEAATAYQNAPAASKATLLGRIELFLQEIIDNFQQVLDNIGATGPIPAIVLGVVNIVLSTLMWIIGKFSKATTTRALMPMQVKMRAGQNQILFITPVERSINQFKYDLNSMLSANGRSDLYIK